MLVMVNIILVVFDAEIDPTKLLNILKEVTPNWYMFGMSLDIPTSELQLIRDNKGPDACFIDMFEVWFNKGDKFATFEILISALENIGNKVLARKVKEQFLTDVKGRYM